MKADLIKVNHLIEIEMETNSGKEYLPSRIEEIDKEYWYISTPMRKGVYITLRVGQRIKIILRYKNSVFGCITTIAARRRGHLPVLVVEKPADLQGVNQKRTYVRLPVTLSVAFRMLLPDNQKSPIFMGKTGDFSAGGLLLLTPVEVQQGQKIELEVKLPDRDPVFCKAHVVRVLSKAVKEGDDNKLAIEYDHINEGQRDKIFKFIFDKQREWIKKGVQE
ncbi:MAG: flagellar brake protein [Syntrophomonas sp.]